jgi:hypothetical protein
MPHNGLPDAWFPDLTSDPVQETFKPAPAASLARQSAPLQPSIKAVRVGAPARIRVPVDRALAPTVINAPIGQLTFTGSTDEFAALIGAINRSTGHGSGVAFGQDRLAMGMVGFGMVMLLGIGVFAATKSPATQQQAALEQIERISARESANTRRLAEKAAEQRPICISFYCGGK